MTIKEIFDNQSLQYAILNERNKQDISFFIEEYVKIEDRDAAEIAIPFHLWEGQRTTLLSFLSDRLIQILKARQLGLTWLALTYAIWNMIYKNGFSVIALSKTEGDADELVRRGKFILEHLPEWIIKPTEWEGNMSSITIKKHKEPATFQSFPASQNSGRSFTANLVILDEWAFQQWARDIWKAAYPSINRPTGGQVIGLSTIERGTLFEDLWLDTKNGFKKIFLPWNSDPRRDEKWYEATRAAMGDGVFSEYPASVEEAFSIPGGAFFNEFRTHAHIKPHIESIPKWYTKIRVMDYGLDMLACYWIYIDDQGFARIYKELYRENLVISEAAYEILKMSGAKVPATMQEWDALTVSEKQDIAATQTEGITLHYAPPDLFNKSAQTGKEGATIWMENGINLTKTNNALEQGCLALTEWLHPIILRDEQTGAEFSSAHLTIDEGAAPNLVHSLLNIQKDKHNPKVYAKQPHGLTHACVTGDTIINTLDGNYSIGELVGRCGNLFCYDEKTGEKSIGEYMDVRVTQKNAPIYRIVLENGKELKCTGDHKILTSTGWKQASVLTAEDDVVEISI